MNTKSFKCEEYPDNGKNILLDICAVVKILEGSENLE